MNEASTTQVVNFVYRRLTEPFSLFGWEPSVGVWVAVVILVLLAGLGAVVWLSRKVEHGAWLPVLAVFSCGVSLLLTLFLMWLASGGTPLRALNYLIDEVDSKAKPWLVVLNLVLIPAFFYVGWMYIKDSRGIGPVWASGLGLMRACVYGLLAYVFLLPAQQVWEDTKDQSHVLVVVDPTKSMETRDDPPEEGKPFTANPTRMDKVLAFLEKDDSAFMNRLLEKNPVHVYRFGTRLDENFLYFPIGGQSTWTREELEAKQKNPDPTKEFPTPELFSRDLWHTFLMPKSGNFAPDWKPDGKSRQELLEHLNHKLVEAGMFNNTNVTDSVLAAVNREINKMVQGIVVFTDGRNSVVNSSQSLLNLEQRAKQAGIPLFIVGVGSERPVVKLEFVDIRVPRVIRPEDSFKAVVELTGEGLPEQDVAVEMEVTRVNRLANGKEEALDIVLVESDTKAPKDMKKEEIVLGKSIKLQPTDKVTFDRGTPPRAEAEFQIDAAALARAAGVDLTDPKYRGKKWEIQETKGSEKDGDEIRFEARTKKHKLEIFPDEFHKSEKVGMKVLRKPLEVLLFTSGALRDFQFARTLLFREMEKERVKLSIYLQPPPGVAEPREGIVLDVPAKRLLHHFPDKFDQAADDEDAKLQDLATYDVIIAFDPDWTQLTPQQLTNVQKWVDRGGGLIVVGGPINTLQLARPGAHKDKLKPILDLYPVILKDIRIEEMDRKPDRPWPLSFEGATPEMEFLKLSDAVEQGTQPFLSDWQEFWGRKKDNPDKTAVQRGFYSYYPVEEVKTGAIVVARFTDPASKMKNGQQQPFLVINPEGANRRVVWLGAGEIWRLRQYKEAFHERFWTKLVRYAGSANAGKSSKRITINMSRHFIANKFVEVEAKIEGKGGQPLARNAKPPEITLKLPAGVNAKEIPTELAMKPKPGSEGRFSAKFMVRSPGSYGLELRVPETKDTATEKFIVDAANPELDNTKPDFDLMYRMASEADHVLARMGKAEQVELRKRLTPPQLTDVKVTEKQDPKEAKEDSDKKLRLYFDLKNADLIPSCMITDLKTSRSRGPVTDLWDEGFVIWPATAPQQPIRMSYVLAIGVGLLSLEWLTRKLLRLA